MMIISKSKTKEKKMNKNKLIIPQCTLCSEKDKICRVIEGSGPVYCPTNNYKKSIEKAIKEYKNPEIRKFAKMASIQEAECYSARASYTNRHIKPYILHPVKPRVEEICEFAKKMSHKKLGIAFCAGLHSEARALTKILKAQNLEVVSIVCKVGCTPKEKIGIDEEDKIRIILVNLSQCVVLSCKRSFSTRRKMT